MVRRNFLFLTLPSSSSPPSSSPPGCLKCSNRSVGNRLSLPGNNRRKRIGTTAQQIVFKLFLLQSAAFFLFLCHHDDVAASPAYNYNYHSYYDSNNNNNNHINLLNDSTHHPTSNHFRHFYSTYPHGQHPFERSNPFLRSRGASFMRTSLDDVSVYRDFTTCSNEVLTLTCPTPDSTVFLLSLFPLPNNDEAARDPNACVAPVASPTALPYSTSSPIDLSCQYFKNNVQTTRSRCKTSSSCTVHVSDLFDYTTPVQRSCTVMATFQCHPSPKMKNLPQYLRFCTNDLMRLTCSDKQDWLVITTAVYDFRPPGGDKTCSTIKRNVYCYAPQTQSVIRNHCERKRTCKLFINDTTFGPIYGRSSLAAAQPSNQRHMPLGTAEPDATAQCPSTDHFALYVYFMCVPKVILSPHPRSLVAGSGNSASTASGNDNKQQPPSSAIQLLGNNGNSRLTTTPLLMSKEDEASSRENSLSSSSGNKQGQQASQASSTKSSQTGKKASPPSTPVAAGVITTTPSQRRSSTISTQRSPIQALPTSSPASSNTEVVSSSIIDQPSSVFQLFSDWLFALDYIQRNPYPVLATACLGICVGLLLGAAVLLIRLSCRLRAARYHPPRRSVGLQCEMFAGRPAVLVRSTASQTSNTSSTRPSSGVQEPPQPQPPTQQAVQQQQQQPQPQRILTTNQLPPITANGHHHNNSAYQQQQQQQQSMQAMAAMCAQTTVAPPSGVLNPSLYAGPPAATAVAASRPLLVPQSQQPQHNNYNQQTQPLLQQQQQQPSTMTSSLGSSSVGSQAGVGSLPNNGPNRNYTYTPRLSVRWFQ